MPSAYSIRWTRRALKRVDEIGSYIAQDNQQAASKVVTRIMSAIASLQQVSMKGRPGRISRTRELILPDMPYIIAYRIDGQFIDILTVIHTSQRWPLSL